MPKVLQWGLLLFFLCALVVSMAIASVTLALYWEHNRARNYLGYRFAMLLPSDYLPPSSRVEARPATSSRPEAAYIVMV